MDVKERARIFARSFLMQALWGRSRMQNLGLLFSLSPALERIYPDPREQKAAALRHTEFFNTLFELRFSHGFSASSFLAFLKHSMSLPSMQ